MKLLARHLVNGKTMLVRLDSDNAREEVARMLNAGFEFYRLDASGRDLVLVKLKSNIGSETRETVERVTGAELIDV